MIEFESVSRAYGKKWAVRDLSFTVSGGEVFGLLGPNGAGKTTAIRMMTGLLLPTAGRIRIAGHDVAVEPIQAKSVTGYIPDRSFLYEKLTVREFLTFVVSIYDIPGDVARERMKTLIERFGLGDVDGAFIESLSQGMRQRLLFASALVHEPRVLVIDEPIVGLDPFGVKLVTKVIAELSSSGVAVFLATHSLTVAAEVCHRVGLIDGGKLIALKDRDEVVGYDGGLEGLFMREVRDSGQ